PDSPLCRCFCDRFTRSDVNSVRSRRQSRHSRRAMNYCRYAASRCKREQSDVLSWAGLDDRVHAAGGDAAQQQKATLGKKPGELVGRALAAAGEDHHVDVELMGEMRAIVRWQHGFYDQKLGMSRRHGADLSQDGNALLIGPVVENCQQDVAVGWQQGAAEEIAALKLKAVSGSDLRDDVRLVEQNTARLRRCLEDGFQHVTEASADVGDGPEAGEIVGREYRTDGAFRFSPHRVVEEFKDGGMIIKVSEHATRLNFAYTSLSGADDVFHLGVAVPEERTPDEAHVGAKGMRMIAA